VSGAGSAGSELARAVLDAAGAVNSLRLRRFVLWLAVMLCALSVGTCLALKAAADVMASRAGELAVTAVRTHDAAQLVEQQQRIASWARASDYVTWGAVTVLVLGTAAGLVALHHLALRPLFGLVAAMKAFASGKHEARAEGCRSVELCDAAGTFNAMAETIDGQHESMLEFLGGAAQRFKNPMQVMRGALRDLAPDRPLPPEPVTRARHALLLRELEEMERLTEKYLDASQIEWRRLDLQIGRHDLRPLVEQAARAYGAFSSIHQILVSASEEPVPVFMDTHRIAQVVDTLLINAIQQSPRGGVIEVGVCAQGEKAMLSVTDHGIGMRPEQVKTVFQPFQFQSIAAAPKTSGNAADTLVALSVVRRIVEAHQGSIDVESAVGKGSTFRVSLPIAGPSPAKEQDRRAAESRSASPHAREGTRPHEDRRP
jgi:two-component system sensor histidine kinase BaeS